jgi:two-component system, sensor histidine kinase and response regulator
MNVRPKILIVDDKPENLKALEVVLADLDVELIRAESGNDALKATLHHDFTLALLDIQMPEMDGFELASILREEEKTSHLPFIFISAIYTDNLNIFKGYEKGAFSFITKPFQPAILINKVKFFVEKHLQKLELVELNEKLKNKNNQLVAINNELESFSYSVSHDLRAPLRIMNAYSNMLETNYTDVLDESGRKLIGSIQRNALKMSQLIDDLLSFSQLEKEQVNKSQIDMKTMVENVNKEIEEITHHKAKVNILGLPEAYGDASLVKQVWVNLLSNAIKYSRTRENAKVTIAAIQEQQEVIYFIRDNGVGFNMEHASNLFGVFQRLHTSSEFEGTGIGLAIVQRVVTKHDGRVWFESEPNKGTTFYFTLGDNPNA